MDYDFEKNIKKLINRYMNKIEWLNNNMNNDNKEEFEGIISGLKIAIHDFEDMMDGLNM